MTLRTPLCDLLGIELPILQAGMAGVAGPALAAAVSNAGGLGILGGYKTTPDELRQLIAETRRLTDRPFGVNLLLSHDLIQPAEEIANVDEVQAALNPMRAQLGIPTKSGPPTPPDEQPLEKLEIVLEEKILVLSLGLSDPGPDVVSRCHAQGMRVIAMATRKEDAQTLAASGVDAIVAQGGEGGGHRSHFTKPADAGTGVIGTMVLVPEIVDAVDPPVIAAGGIVDGRGLVAALALGAQAVMIGTRFVATPESEVVASYKQALLAARSDDTTVTDVASGRYARLLRNEITESYGDGPVLPFGWHGNAIADLFQAAREAGDSNYQGLWSGQAAGLINDLTPAAEIVSRIAQQARDILQKLSR